MENEEHSEMEELPESSERELEMASAAGLAQVRKFGNKKYILHQVARRENRRKVDSLLGYAENLKAQRIPVRTEWKSNILAVYVGD